MRATCSKLEVAINKFQKAFSFYSTMSLDIILQFVFCHIFLLIVVLSTICTILLPPSMMEGHEVKRASNGEPLVVLKDEFGLLQCVWSKKKFSGVPGGLFSGPAVWIWFQVPYLMQVHFLLRCFHEIYVISLSTGICKEERKQDYRKLWKKGRLTHRRVSLISLHDQVPFKFKSRIMSTG